MVLLEPREVVPAHACEHHDHGEHRVQPDSQQCQCASEDAAKLGLHVRDLKAELAKLQQRHNRRSSRRDLLLSQFSASGAQCAASL